MTFPFNPVALDVEGNLFYPSYTGQAPTTLPVVVQFASDGSFVVPAPQIIPLTDNPVQTVNVTLGGQAVTIRLYTKSLNIPISPPGSISSMPPTYQNSNPVFLDLFLSDALVLGGVPCLNLVPMVRDVYLGFSGDLIMYDTQGVGSPQGFPATLPPLELRNDVQRALPLYLAGKAPAPLAGRIPGLGTRFLLLWQPGLP